MSSFVNTFLAVDSKGTAFVEEFHVAHRGTTVDNCLATAKGADSTHKKLSSPPSTAASRNL